MTMTHPVRSGGRRLGRRVAALAAGAALAVGAAAGAPSAAAAPPVPPAPPAPTTPSVPAAPPAPDDWMSTTPEGYHRFTASQAEVQGIVGGTPSVVELEGNIGPAGTWSDVAMDPSGDNYQTMWGPVPPGLYYYQYTATMPDRTRISFRNPDSGQSVTSHPSWNTFFVPGPEVAWMADAAKPGAVTELPYTSVGTRTQRSALVWTPPGYQAARHARYPVLYLLADKSQSYRDWAGSAGCRRSSTTSPPKGHSRP